MSEVTVIGAGLAGSEAAWQIARRGICVRLVEMRPIVNTPAHVTDQFSELVCSNSLRADTPAHAAGLLKQEMRLFGSLLMEAAGLTRVPAGRALAVDRRLFSRYVTERLSAHPNVEVVRQEAAEIPVELGVIASGPLTSDRLASAIGRLLGVGYLHFFDALAPIVYADSIDRERTFAGSRYEPEQDDYLNCPMDEGEYREFHRELVCAERRKPRGFELENRLFEGCLPIEEMAGRGADTIRYGPLRPVGLVDPRTGKRPFAVVQLRREDAAGVLYNIVGFQTNLKQGEQRRVFGLIPALRDARYARLGAMHRNTFINAPLALRPTLQSRERDDLLFAGQITGVEGYVESAAMGIVAGINAARLCRGMEPVVFPPETAHGALCRYITTTDPDRFQPMNVNFGLFDPVAARKREEKIGLMVERALDAADKVRKRLEADDGV